MKNMKGLSIAQQDLIEWQAYCQQAEAEFEQEQGAAGLVDVRKVQALQKAHELPAGQLPSPWEGPWQVARRFVTTEFRSWIEDYGHARLTFSDWRVRARAQREQQRLAEQGYEGSVQAPLDQLEDLRRMEAQRDEWIVQARERGAEWAAIVEASGMSRTYCAKVWRTARQEVAAYGQRTF